MPLVHIDRNPPPRILRNFGWVGFGVFSLLATWAFIAGRLIWFSIPNARNLVGALLAVIAVAFGALAAVSPRSLKKIYVGLSIATYPIGVVTSYLMMGLIFFLIITPIGLVFRLIGRDCMGRAFRADVPTYWIPHRTRENTKSYFRQF